LDSKKEDRLKNTPITGHRTVRREQEEHHFRSVWILFEICIRDKNVFIQTDWLPIQVRVEKILYILKEYNADFTDGKEPATAPPIISVQHHVYSYIMSHICH